MSYKYILSTLILFFFTGYLLCATGIQTGYEIKFKIDGAENGFVSLAYHLGDKQYIKDTCRTDAGGSGEFAGIEPLEQGLYMIVMPDNKYFEIIISDDQHFSVQCRREDLLKSLKFDGSDENEAFVAYQRKWIVLQNQSTSIRARMTANTSSNDSLEILSDMQSKHQKDMIDFLKKTVNEQRGTLLSALVGAMVPVELPEFDIPVNEPNPDSLRWVMSYNYNKAHFFDYIDLTDNRLIRTPLLYNKIYTYFNNVILQVPDTEMLEIDRIVDICEKDEEVFRFIVVFLFNHYRESMIMGHDGVMVKLADDYYLSGRADWVTDEFKESLKKDVDLLRFNLIGKKAVDFTMETYEGIPRSLYDIDKPFTIIYFWEPNCGHCKESTPLLKELYNNYDRSEIEIFAICTQDDREEWEKYIAENSLEWINGWDPFRDSHFDFYYNVNSTPMVYILNNEKTIIAKKLPVESISQFLDNYKQQMH